MHNYQSISHAKLRIHYHLIFSTKCRRPAFETFENELQAMICKINHKKYTIVECGVDRDHVHIVVNAQPTITVGSIVADLKKKTTLWAWDNYEEIMLHYFWGVYTTRRRMLWTHGYFCETVGNNVSYDKILKYVQNQGQCFNTLPL